jgi:hypothetical protein
LSRLGLLLRKVQRLRGQLQTRRDFVKIAGSAGAALAAPSLVASCRQDDYPTGPVTTDPRAFAAPSLIEGYPSAPSYRPGETAYFHLSNKTHDPRTKVQILRIGRRVEPVQGPWIQRVLPQEALPNASQDGCAWPVTFELELPPSWPSGAYIARVSSVDAEAITSDILFVVKPVVRSASILYQLPVNTYQAYNLWGGTSLYTSDAQAYSNPFVSFERPYRHLGQFWYLDVPFLQWMARRGIGLDCCTSVDLHSDPGLTLNESGYQLLLSVGHDEYWSWEMRDNVEAFVESGGNVAFFGGNTCWWQIRYEPDARRIVCYKDPQQGTWRDPALAGSPLDQRRVTTNWFASPVNRPEEQMTGLSFRYGAFVGAGAMPRTGFHAGPTDHWAFGGLFAGQRDTYLSSGSVSPGSPPVPERLVQLREQPGVLIPVFIGSGVVGRETDAAPLHVTSDGSPRVDGHNIPVISEDLENGKPPYQPPDSIMVLASTDLLHWPGKAGRATMAVYRKNGVVFNVGTQYWARALESADDVRTITRNVIEHLTIALPPSPPLVNLGFEQWSQPNEPDGWLGPIAQAAGPQIFPESRPDFLRTGGFSLRVNAQAGEVWLSQEFMATRGSYYVVSGWIRSDSAISDNDGHWLLINLVTLETPPVTLASAQYAATGGGWEHVRAYGRASGAGAVPVQLRVGSSFPGDAWFDDLRVDLI